MKSLKDGRRAFPQFLTLQLPPFIILSSLLLYKTALSFHKIFVFFYQ